MTDLSTCRALVVGVHVLDVHVLHVESIPEGSDGQLVERISLSAAGTAGGTAVVLADLGVPVSSVGAVGDDPAGHVLRSLLEQHGIDTSGLVVRDAQTSSSVLPVRPNGDRPAWHCIARTAPSSPATSTGTPSRPPTCCTWAARSSSEATPRASCSRTPASTAR